MTLDIFHAKSGMIPTHRERRADGPGVFAGWLNIQVVEISRMGELVSLHYGAALINFRLKQASLIIARPDVDGLNPLWEGVEPRKRKTAAIERANGRFERCTASIVRMRRRARTCRGKGDQISGSRRALTVGQTNAFSRDGRTGGGVLRARSGSEMKELV